MDSNKRGSLLRKKLENGEGTESRNRPKRRISFSGKKAVREFSKENEARAWDHSYEVSDHAVFEDQQQPEIAGVVSECNEESTVKQASVLNNLTNIEENNSNSLNFNVSQDVTLLPHEKGAKRDIAIKSATSLCVDDSMSVSFSLLDKDKMQLGCFKKSSLKERTVDYMRDLSNFQRDFSISNDSIGAENAEQMVPISLQTSECCATNLKKDKYELLKQNTVDMEVEKSFNFNDFSLNSTTNTCLSPILNTSDVLPEFLSCGKKYNLRQFNEDLENGKIRAFCGNERTPIKRMSHFQRTKESLNDMEAETKTMCSTNETKTNEGLFNHGDISGIMPTEKLKSKKDHFRFSQADEMMLDNTNFLAQAKLGDETNSRNSSKSSTSCSRRETVFYDEDIKCEFNSNTHGNADQIKTKTDDIPYYLNPEHLRKKLNSFGSHDESQRPKIYKPKETETRNQSEIGLDISMISNRPQKEKNIECYLDPLNSENLRSQDKQLWKDQVKSKNDSRQSIYVPVDMEIDEDIIDQAVSQNNSLYNSILKNEMVNGKRRETCYVSESIETDIPGTILSDEDLETDGMKGDEVVVSNFSMGKEIAFKSCKDNQKFEQKIRKIQKIRLNQQKMLENLNTELILTDENIDDLCQPSSNIVSKSKDVEHQYRENKLECSMGSRSRDGSITQLEICNTVKLEEQSKSNTLLLNEDLEVDENPMEVINNSFSQAKLHDYDVKNESTSNQGISSDICNIKKGELSGQSVSINQPNIGRRGTMYTYEDIKLEQTIRNTVTNGVECLATLSKNGQNVPSTTGVQNGNVINVPVENIQIIQERKDFHFKSGKYYQNESLELSTIAGLQIKKQLENPGHTIVENKINLLNDRLKTPSIIKINEKEVDKDFDIMERQRVTIYGNEDLEVVEQKLDLFEDINVVNDAMITTCKAQTTIYGNEDLELEVVDTKNCVLSNDDIKSTYNTNNVNKVAYAYEDIDLVTENMENFSKIKYMSYKEDKISDSPISNEVNNIRYNEKLKKPIDTSRRTIVFLDHNDMEIDGVSNSTSANYLKDQPQVNDEHAKDILENNNSIRNIDNQYCENNIENNDFSYSGNLNETKARSISNIRPLIRNFKNPSYETPKRSFKTIEMTPHKNQRTIVESTPCRSLLEFEMMEKQCMEDLLEVKQTGITIDFHEYFNKKGLTNATEADNMIKDAKNNQMESLLKIKEMKLEQTENMDKGKKGYKIDYINNNTIEIKKNVSDCQIEEMDISNCQYSDTVTNSKRLSQNITPNLPHSKKRQTVFYNDCDLVENTITQANQEKLKTIKQKISYTDSHLSIQNNHNEFDKTDLKGCPQDVNLTLNNSLKNSLLEPIEVPRRLASVYEQNSVKTETKKAGGNDYIIVKDTENTGSQAQEIRKYNEHVVKDVKEIIPSSSEVFHNRLGCFMGIGSDNEDRNMTKFYNITLSGKETENIDKTHLSLVETILDDTVDESIKQINIPENYQELEAFSSKNNDEKTNFFKTGAIPKVQKNDAPFCRKCKGCEVPLTNESDFSLIDTGKNFSKFALPKINRDIQSKLQKQPTITDLIRSRMRKSLEKAMIISDSEDEFEDLKNQPSVKDIIRREMVESADRIAKLEETFRFSNNDAEDTKKRTTTETMAWIEKSEAEMDQKIEEVKQLLKYLRTPQKSFVERLGDLLKTNAPNWIFNYRVQALNKFIFYHKKIQTSLIEINYDELDNGANIKIKSTRLRRNGFSYRYWLPLHHVMEFQVQLELPYHDLIGYSSGNEELLVCDMLSKFDQTFLYVRKMVFTFWRIIMREDATLIREGPFCYVRKIVRKYRDLSSDIYLNTNYQILIVIRDLTKLCYKDIVIPRLHLIDESITELPIGLEFLSTFLGNPLRFMKLEKFENQAFL